MTEVDSQYTTWRVKAMWAGTSTTYLIEAKDAAQAKERCYRLLDQITGGDSCLRVDVLGETK